jgi:signal transduction histidine kinase
MERNEIAPLPSMGNGAPPQIEKSAPADRAHEYAWHVLARWIGAGGLGLTALLAHHLKYVDTVGQLVAIALSVALYNLAFVLSPWRRVSSRVGTLVVLTLDVVAITAFLHYSGDLENPLIISYSLPVVAGAVMANRRVGIFLASLALALFSVMMAATLIDAFPFHLTHHHLDILAGVSLHEKIDPDLVPQNIGYLLSHGIVLGVVLYGSAIGFGALSEQIHEASEKISLLLRILPDGAVLLDRTGRILVSNPSAERILGPSIRIADPDLGLAARLAAFQGPVEEFETTWHGRFLGHALAQASPQGPVVWVFRDLTQERRLMAQVMHAAKMADLGLLAAGVAHEIGNPLSTMSAIIQVIEMKKPPPEFGDRLRTLGASVERIRRIVQDIGSYARPSEGRRSSLSIAALVEKTAAIFKLHDKSKEMKLEVACPDSLPPVDAVEDQLIQVLLNLLLNAADASHGRGSVWVDARVEDGELAISVRDKGSGIEPESQKRLFTPFFTTKEQGKGEGLGLFVSESIVHGHGGRITVESTRGSGAVFTIRLPLGKRAA